ncbi:hypothetical protein [Pendulispora albinea]|uniref:Tetratricopeptide repeat protein n=1 Tax=Pendulispora albinea TaxID=2741071 RepID=A0ABZ2M1S9_9BACT
MRRQSAFGFFLVSLFACRAHEHPPAAHDRVAAAPVARPAAAVGGAVEAPAPRRTAGAVGPVGLRDLGLPSPAALAENDAAVKRLARGDVGPAVAGLEKALQSAPGFVLARYNLACARARAGDMEGAERELTQVFEADFIGLRAQASRDPDLVDFRASDPGKRLFAKVFELEARYRASLSSERGLRAMLWQARTERATDPENLRVGVWDSSTSRFVAVSERERGPLSAYVASDLPFAILTTGSRPTMLAGDLADHFYLHQVLLWPYTTDGAPLARIPVDKGGFSGQVHIVEDAVTVLLSSGIGYEKGEPLGRLTGARISFSPERGAGKLEFATSAFKAPKVDHGKAGGTLGMPFHNGSETWSSSAGYSWKWLELKLPDGRVVKVPKNIAFGGDRPPSIVASPRGDRVALVWDTHVCECGTFVGSHRIVLVDTATMSATTIAAGTGVGAVRFDPGGTLFVQRDRQTFEVADPRAASTWRALPPGVLLVPPVAPEADIACCGF